MKLMVAALLLAAACQAEVAGSKQKEDSRTQRRAAEGTVQKRAPAILPRVTPTATPGIEYADSKDSQTEKTPAQIYSRPESQVAKISDVLTGHGPPFPAAIANHLFSPLPVYQPRLSSPTTYEISAPIPSQLAYSEHKISYQPQQNAIQYTPQEYNQKLTNPKQAIARLTVNYQPYPQHLLVQPQPIVYSQQQPQHIQQFPIYQAQPINQQPIQYNQAPQAFQAQPAYQQPLIQLVQAQPGITYAEQEQSEEQTHQRPAQRELKTGQPEAIKALEEKAKPQPQKNYNIQPQGAVSYASFSVGAPAASFAQTQYQQQQQPQQQQQNSQLQYQQSQQQQQQYQQQRQQPHQQQQNSQLQYQQPQQQQQQYQLLVQPQQYQQPTQQQYQPQYQQIQYQPPAIQYQPQQYQVPQYQPAPQRQIISKPEQQNLIAIPIKPNQKQIYFRQSPLPIQPFQGQVYQGQETPGYQAAAPHFPPVQYFGKFAHSIFGQYQ